MSIPDLGTVEATVVVAGLGSTITDLDLRFDGTNCSTADDATTVGLTHSYIGDLDIQLISPTEEIVHLTNTDVGMVVGSNMCQTTFSDEAIHEFVNDNDIPGTYSGSWKPSESLSTFDSQDPNGTWTLRIEDVAALDEGVLRSFSLLVTTADSAPPPPQPVEYSYDGPSVAIPNIQDGPATKVPLEVSASGTIADIDLRIGGTACSSDVDAVDVGLRHLDPSQLDIRLTSPTGATTVMLAEAGRSQATGANLCLTTFTDEAPLLWSAADSHNAPYAGVWRPRQVLSAFDGQQAGGTWWLSITDRDADFPDDDGELHAFSLLVTTDEVGSAGPSLPARFLDTRPDGVTFDGQSQATGVVGAGSTVPVPISGRGPVAASAEAVAVNLTAVGSAGTGFVTAFACGQDRPNASSLNLVAGQTVANMVVVQPAADGRLCLYTSVSTHLIVDVIHTFGDGSALEPRSPMRLLDTRTNGTSIDGKFTAGGLVPADAQIEVELAGRGGVPIEVDAVVVNITAVNPKTSGYLTVWPCDAPRPNASTHNFQAGVTKPSTVFAALDHSGATCMYTSSAVHLVADITGYFDVGSGITPLLPVRLVDSRPLGATVDGQFWGPEYTLPGGVVAAIPVTGRGDIPAQNGVSIVLNIVATGPHGDGYLTVWDCATPEPPNISTVNFAAGHNANNHTITATGVDGVVCVYASAATNFIIDAEALL